MKKLYKIYSEEEVGYDMYDSAIVCAESEEAAKDIDPGEGKYRRLAWLELDSNKPCADYWLDNREDVKVQYIGIADDSIELNSVILTSFNAG